MNDEARLWAKIEKTDSCWLWTGSFGRKGYGRTRWDGRSQAAHRVVYELLVGPIPEGLTLDHLCRVRNCINPAHLEPVTSTENIRRGGNAAKTHCPKGHPYDEANTIRKMRGTWNCRDCRECKRADDRARVNRKTRERQLARLSPDEAGDE